MIFLFSNGTHLLSLKPKSSISSRKYIFISQNKQISSNVSVFTVALTQTTVQHLNKIMFEIRYIWSKSVDTSIWPSIYSKGFEVQYQVLPCTNTSWTKMWRNIQYKEENMMLRCIQEMKGLAVQCTFSTVCVCRLQDEAKRLYCHLCWGEVTQCVEKLFNGCKITGMIFMPCSVHVFQSLSVYNPHLTCSLCILHPTSFVITQYTYMHSILRVLVFTAIQGKMW